MQQGDGDGAGIHYLAPSNCFPFPNQAQFSANNDNIPMFQFGRLSNPFLNTQVNPRLQELNSRPPSFSGNSTSDEADEQQRSLNERKQRRMISNRESARRARMRKQKHLDELWSQVMWLRNENDQLIEKMNHVLECHDQALQENAQLKQETIELHQTVRDLQLCRPYASLKDLEEVSCNIASLGAESSDISNSSMGGLPLDG